MGFWIKIVFTQLTINLQLMQMHTMSSKMFSLLFKFQ